MCEYYIRETGEALLDVRRIGADGMVEVGSGSAVRAKTGDYLVTYPDGSTRVASAGAFELLYAK